MTVTRSVAALAAATILCVTAPGHAANVVDQNASTNNSYMAGFSQTDLAQSFKQTATNISGAGIFLQDGQGSGNSILSISLWTALPNATGAVMLATASAANSTNNRWFDVFWSPISVVSGATYYLAFDDDRNAYGIAGDLNNGYTNGQVYANGGFGSFPTYDYTFRTYTENAIGAVPEPATWGMMLAGFGLVGGAMRYRRRRTSVSFG